MRYSPTKVHIFSTIYGALRVWWRGTPILLVLSIAIGISAAPQTLPSEQQKKDDHKPSSKQTAPPSGKPKKERPKATEKNMPPLYKIIVVVLDPRQRPVNDAEVWTNTIHKRAGESSEWQLEVLSSNVPADGKITIYAAKNAAFLTGYKSIRLGSEASPQVEIQLTEEKRVLQARVIDLAGEPVAGVRLTTTQVGAAEGLTDEMGRVRIRLNEKTLPNDFIDIVIADTQGSNLVLVAPRGGRTRIPPFENDPEDIVEVLVTERGDPALMKNGRAKFSILQNLNDQNSPKSPDEKITDEQRRANLEAEAKYYGLDPDELDKAIREWILEDDRYKKGLQAYYKKDYATSTELLGASFDSIADKTVERAIAYARSLSAQEKAADALTALQRVIALKPDDVSLLNALALALYSDGRYLDSARAFDKVITLRKEKPCECYSRSSESDDLYNLAGAYMAGDSLQLARTYSKKALDLRKQHLKQEHYSIGVSYAQLAQIDTALDRHTDAENEFQLALKIIENSFGQDSQEFSRTQHKLAALYIGQGKFDEAENLLKSAIENAEKDRYSRSDLSIHLTTLSNIYYIKNRLDDSLITIQRALQIQQATLRKDHPLIATSKLILASIYTNRRQTEMAEKIFLEVLAIYNHAPDQNQANIALVQQNLGWFYARGQQFEKSDAAYGIALKIYKRMYTFDHSNLAVLYAGMGELDLYRENYTEAERLATLSLNMLNKLFGPQSQGSASPHTTLARILTLKGHLKQAETHCLSAMAILEKSFGKDSAGLTDIISELANIYENGNKLALAQAKREQILRIEENAPQSDPYSLASALNNLAWNLYLQKKYSASQPFVEKGIKIMLDNTNPESLEDDNFLAAMYDTLGNIQMEQKDFTMAEQNFLRSLEIYDALPSTPNKALAKRSLAKLYRDTLRYPEAEKLFKEVILTQETSIGPESSELQISRSEYAVLLRRIGRENEAVILERVNTGIRKPVN